MSLSGLNFFAFSSDYSKYQLDEFFVLSRQLGISWTEYHKIPTYARRYLIVRHGITFSDVNNAYEIPSAKFTKLNGNSVIMNNNVAVGSLIIWPQYYKIDGYEGHVAVVSSISTKGIRVAEQNYDDRDFNRFIPFTDLQNVIFLSLS